MQLQAGRQQLQLGSPSKTLNFGQVLAASEAGRKGAADQLAAAAGGMPAEGQPQAAVGAAAGVITVVLLQRVRNASPEMASCVLLHTSSWCMAGSAGREREAMAAHCMSLLMLAVHACIGLCV